MQTSRLTATVARAQQGNHFNVLGHAITTVLAKQNTEGHYYVFECVTPPGLGIPPHVHDREDEIIFIAEGEFGIQLGEQQLTAKAGDTLFFPRHIPHGFQNIGSKAGKTIWTVIPGGNFEAFFEKLSALPGGEPDLEKVAAIFSEFGMKILLPENA